MIDSWQSRVALVALGQSVTLRNAASLPQSRTGHVFRRSPAAPHALRPNGHSTGPSKSGATLQGSDGWMMIGFQRRGRIRELIRLCNQTAKVFIISKGRVLLFVPERRVTCAETGTRHNQLGSTEAVGLSMAPTF